MLADQDEEDENGSARMVGYDDSFLDEEEDLQGRLKSLRLLGVKNGGKMSKKKKIKEDSSQEASEVVTEHMEAADVTFGNQETQTKLDLVNSEEEEVEIFGCELCG